MNKLRIYGALLVLVFALIIIMQNVEVINVRVLFFTLFVPKATLLGMTLLTGIILGILFAGVLRRRR